jgi:hypothetical protein
LDDAAEQHLHALLARDPHTDLARRQNVPSASRNAQVQLHASPAFSSISACRRSDA